jgi:DNA invertase Pin-like site-specific DNA recombinase
MKPLVSYIRVSTSQQARSGLGIEAQREGLAWFADTEGFEIVAEFVEVETGKGSDALDRRPRLSAALAKARAVVRGVAHDRRRNRVRRQPPPATSLGQHPSWSLGLD